MCSGLITIITLIYPTESLKYEQQSVGRTEELASEKVTTTSN